MSDKHQKDIATLIELFDQSDWQELSLKIDDLELFVSNDSKAKGLAAGEAAPAKDAAPPAAKSASPQPSKDEPVTDTRTESAVPEGQVVIRAANVGTFYRAPTPGEAPYVEVGDVVTPETEVCLIEVMKLFTPQQAGVSGVISKICIEDTQMVEYDQPMFYVEQEK